MLTDHYQVLGVDPGADEASIKAAGRRLQLKHHPDRGADSGDHFQRVTLALEVLLDPRRRARFDRLRRGEPLTLDLLDLEDLDGALRPRGATRRGADLTENLHLSVMQSVFGGAIELPERGRVRVPCGVQAGVLLRCAGRGGPGDPPGDLLLRVVIDPDPTGAIRREADDLHIQLPITWFEALRRGRFRLPTPWGLVDTELPASVAGGAELELPGFGIRSATRPAGRLVAHPVLLAPAADRYLLLYLEALQGTLRPRQPLEARLAGGVDDAETRPQSL